MEKIVSPIFSVPLRFEKEKKKKKNISRVFVPKIVEINAFLFKRKFY